MGIKLKFSSFARGKAEWTQSSFPAEPSTVEKKGSVPCKPGGSCAEQRILDALTHDCMPGCVARDSVEMPTKDAISASREDASVALPPHADEVLCFASPRGSVLPKQAQIKQQAPRLFVVILRLPSPLPHPDSFNEALQST